MERMYHKNGYSSPGGTGSAGQCEVELRGEALVLLPERAVWWPSRRTLLVADVHLGKSAAFRAHGLAVPEGHDRDDLARLRELVIRLGSQELIILGDLLHAPAGNTAALRVQVAHWCEGLDAQVTVVAGNHDRGLAHWAAEAGLDFARGPLSLEPFCLRHEPPELADGPEVPGAGLALCGHLHPMVRMSIAGARHRAPCFWLTARFLMLPAFGSFTGGARVFPRAGDALYAIDQGSVFAVPPAICGVRRAGRQ